MNPIFNVGAKTRVPKFKSVLIDEHPIAPDGTRQVSIRVLKSNNPPSKMWQSGQDEVYLSRDRNNYTLIGKTDQASAFFAFYNTLLSGKFKQERNVTLPPSTPFHDIQTQHVHRRLIQPPEVSLVAQSPPPPAGGRQLTTMGGL